MPSEPSEVWDEATAASFDVDAAAMYRPEVLDPAVEFLATCAGGLPVLELAIGTGRVAIPLRHRGLQVHGIEQSEHMLAVLRRRASADELPVTVGDMATARAPGSFGLVYLVWNGLSNLVTEAAQAACFRNAAAHLVPSGRFVVELWVPQIESDGAPCVSLWSASHVCVDAYDVEAHLCTSHHFVREADGRFRHDTGRFRYLLPEECDDLAAQAGLELEARYGGFDRRPFTEASASHVSVWRRG